MTKRISEAGPGAGAPRTEASGGEPSALSLPPRQRRRWPRRVLWSLATLFLLSAVAVALAPTFLGGLFRDELGEAIGEALEAEGGISGLSLSWVSGLEVEGGSFQTRDGSLELTWRRISSDLDLLDVLSGSDPWHLGETLVIEGARARYTPPPPPGEGPVEGAPEREPAAGPTAGEKPAPAATAGDGARLRLPRLEIRDGAFTFIDGESELRLEGIDMRSGGPVLVEIPSGRAAGTGLEEAVELSLDGEIALRHGAERLDGPLRLTLVLGPSSDPDGLAAEAAIHLSPAVSREPASASGAAGSEDGQAATAASPLSLEGCRLTAQLQGDPIRREDLAGITPERLLSILQGSLRAEAGALSSGDALLEGLQLEGELGEGQARVALAAPARLNGGNIDGNASYRGGRWELALSARDVITSRQLVRLLARISPVFALAQRAPEAVDCRFGGEVIAGGCTGSQKEMIDCLAGTGSLTVSAGSFAAPAELAPLLELLPAADRKRLTFEAFAQPFELSSGRVLNRGFQLAANDAALLIEGHTTLAGELHHNVRLDQVVGRALGRKGRKGREWQIARGILEQNPIVIEGSVDRPRLRLPSPLGGKNPLKGALDTGLDLLRKEAEERASSPEGVEGLIKEGLDLFKKKKKKKP